MAELAVTLFRLTFLPVTYNVMPSCWPYCYCKPHLTKKTWIMALDVLTHLLWIYLMDIKFSIYDIFLLCWNIERWDEKNSMHSSSTVQHNRNSNRFFSRWFPLCYLDYWRLRFLARPNVIRRGSTFEYYLYSCLE